MVEGARLESVYTATYRGFEPLSLRHLCIQRDAKNIKNPQAIWFDGFFYAQRSTLGYVFLVPTRCVVMQYKRAALR